MTSARLPRAAIILAAGQGTRMKSPLPKVLHPVGGRAMLDHAIDAAEALGCERIVVVVGNHSPEVRAHVVERLGEAAIAVQDPPIGTGHAVLAARDALAGFDGEVIVTYGDVPLLKARDIEAAFGGGEGVTVVTAATAGRNSSRFRFRYTALSAKISRMVQVHKPPARWRSKLN